MFRYIAVLLLANLYTGSWGAPTQNSTLLSTMLNELANTCENDFLSTLIKSKASQDCRISVPPYHEKQFECLLFYNMNRQLCDSVASSKLPLKEDYTAKIDAVQDVSDLCNIAKGWTFAKIIPEFEKTFKLVFQDPIKCSKVCSADNEDILNVDSNFYCKYFKWGSDWLKTILNVSTTQSNTNGNASHASDDINLKTAKMENSEIDNTPNMQVKDAESELSAGVIKSSTIEVKSTSDKILTGNVDANAAVHEPVEEEKVVDSAPSAKQIELPETNDKSKKTEPHAVLRPADDSVLAKNSQNIEEKLTTSTKKDDATSKSNEAIEVKKDESAGAIKVDSAPNKDLLNQLENPKPNIADPDEYQVNDLDSEEARDGLQDTQGGDDGDDTVLGDLDLKPHQDQLKKTIKRIETSGTFEISAKDIYTNTIPDGFSEDDDHFFPFFLSAIIMVVLLYILYHNKNKVSKVVLGLIVEGRQSGRRRNSRGHAYRRLDTLEQAMSTNTAAPPSKIIY